METHSYIQSILIFLAAAVVVVTVMRRVVKSPVLGYLLAGLLIGPYGMGLIPGVDSVRAVAEIGVVFLLFTIGLELSWERLMALKRYVFILGAAQVSVTSLIAAGIAWGFGLELDTALLIGCSLCLSSTAVVTQVLAERGDLASRYGRVAFSILLFQDLAVVLFLVLFNLLGKEEGVVSAQAVLTTVVWSFLKALTVIGGIIFFGHMLLRPIYRLVATTKNSELFVAMTLLFILVTGMATEMVGLSMELGAFMAGLLLAETEYRHQVEADIQPFRGLLLGLFFMSVGMGMDLQLLLHHTLTILGIVTALIIGKAVLLVGICRYLGKLWWSSSLRVGLSLAAGGEFAFVLFGPALHDQLLTAHQGHVLFLSVTLSMALTPLLIWIGKIWGRKFEAPGSKLTSKAAQEETQDLKDHVVIVGFSRMGRVISQLLSEMMIPYVAIDMNLAKVTDGRGSGLPVFFGDARRADIFLAIGVERARAVVLTLRAGATLSRALLMLKRTVPHVPVFVRAEDPEQADKLEQAGAVVILPETLEPSLQLGANLLIMTGVSPDQVSRSVDALRQSLGARKNAATNAPRPNPGEKG